MKSRRLWLHFIVHEHKRSWIWKPILLKSAIIYKSQQKMWVAPCLEFCWLFFVIQFTFYSRKTEYSGNYFEEEDIQSLKDRITELEQGIRLHQCLTESAKTKQKDIDLWSLLK